jgi:hypothetical protein
MPSSPILQAWAKAVGPSASMCSLRRKPGAAFASTKASVASRVSSGRAGGRRRSVRSGRRRRGRRGGHSGAGAAGRIPAGRRRRYCGRPGARAGHSGRQARAALRVRDRSGVGITIPTAEAPTGSAGRSIAAAPVRSPYTPSRRRALGLAGLWPRPAGRHFSARGSAARNTAAS